MLVGGEAGSITESLETLRNQGCLDIRWSPQGAGNGGVPRPRVLDIGAFVGTDWGRARLRSVLSFGDHVRFPPKHWKHLRVSVRSVWLRTVGGRSWRLALLELDHRGTQSVDQVHRAALKPAMGLAC